MRRGSLLAVIAALPACSLLVDPTTYPPCDEGSPPRCDGDELVTCSDGFEHGADCGAGKCDADRAVCLEVCGNGITEDAIGERCDDGDATDEGTCDARCAHQCLEPGHRFGPDGRCYFALSATDFAGTEGACDLAGAHLAT